MRLDEAIEVAQTCGVEMPVFYGQVVIRIKAGAVSAVDVTQTFVPST